MKKLMILMMLSTTMYSQEVTEKILLIHGNIGVDLSKTWSINKLITKNDSSVYLIIHFDNAEYRALKDKGTIILNDTNEIEVFCVGLQKLIDKNKEHTTTYLDYKKYLFILHKNTITIENKKGKSLVVSKGNAKRFIKKVKKWYFLFK